MTYTAAIPALPNLLALVPNLIAARGAASLNGVVYQPLVDVRRLSDNATAALYSNASGFIDTASAINFQSTSTLAVTKVYDQSGNGNHATQGTALEQPYLIQNPVTGIWEIQLGDVNGRGTRWLVLPELATNNDCLLLSAGRTHGNYDSDPFVNFDAGMLFTDGGMTTNALGVWFRDPQNTFNYIPANNAFLGTPGLPWDCRNQIVAMDNRTNARIRRYPDINAAFTNNYKGTDVWGTNQIGGSIFAIVPSAYVQCFITASSFGNFGGAAGDAVLSEFFNFFCQSAPHKVIYWFGDSLSDGYIFGQNRDSDRGIPIRVQGILGSTFLVRCGACVGYTIAQNETSAVAHFDDPTLRDGLPVWSVILSGLNDIFQGADASTTLSRLQTFINNRKAAGAAKNIVCTIPVGPGLDVFTSTVQAVNAGIPSLSNVDAVIDLASQTFVFQSDGIHPTTPGDVWTAARYAAPILSAL